MIPATTRIQARPVWRRHKYRTLMNVNQLPAPTEAEIQDAIRVLEDPGNQAIRGLWDEAQRIFLRDAGM